MTSPAQLKYLSAMGIPVWVSRDLIVENDVLLDSSNSKNDDTTLTEHANRNSVIPSRIETPEVAKTNTKVNNSPNSARGILDTLETDSIRPTRVSYDDEAKTFGDNIIDKALDSSKVPAISLSLNEKTQSNNSENLLCESPSHYIFSCGNHNPDWMVIGHSPESFSGIGQEPFAGEAGELLNNMLRAVGIEQPRSQAYLLNVIDKYQEFDIEETNQFESELELKQKLLSIIVDVKPQIILFVGQKSAQNLLECNDPLIIMRSKVHKVSNTAIPAVVTYYPSYLLQKPIDKRKAWNDLKLAMSLLIPEEPQT